jgi:tRNA (guanine9-N1)-methyltransferase
MRREPDWLSGLSLHLRGGSPYTSPSIGVLVLEECRIDPPQTRLMQFVQDDGFGHEQSDIQISTKRLLTDIWKLHQFITHRRQKRAALKLRRRKTLSSRAVNQTNLVQQRVERVAELDLFFARRDERIMARGSRLQRVVIDVGYPGSMTDGECSSLASQIAYCHSANKRSELPLDLAVVFSPSCAREWTALAKFNPHNWDSGQNHGAKVFPKPLSETYLPEECVYLTADATVELCELDPNKVYVVGGLVDRNRHKGAAMRRAQGMGMATARLPIGRYVALQSHHVLTVNHVVALLRAVSGGEGWSHAFLREVPVRKRPVCLTVELSSSQHGSAVSAQGD